MGEPVQDNTNLVGKAPETPRQTLVEAAKDAAQLSVAVVAGS
jgi:hypothetical protein